MTTKPSPSVEFIRLFFKSPEEEKFAVRYAHLIARIVGKRVTLLRLNPTWSEILGWFRPGVRNAALFALLLKQEFGSDFTEVLRNYEFMTFRGFVEYACSHKSRVSQPRQPTPGARLAASRTPMVRVAALVRNSRSVHD